MKNIKYTIYKENEHYVAQCLNVDVSSFGNTIEEAINNLTEAVELYFEDNDKVVFFPIDNVILGEKAINAWIIVFQKNNFYFIK